MFRDKGLGIRVSGLGVRVSQVFIIISEPLTQPGKRRGNHPRSSSPSQARVCTVKSALSCLWAPFSESQL